MSLLISSRILSLNLSRCAFQSLKYCSSNSGENNDKLFSLLKSIKENEALHKKSNVKLNAKPNKKYESSSSSSSSSSEDELEEDLVKAANKVANDSAKDVKDDDQKSKVHHEVKSDLLRQLTKISKETNEARQESEVLSSMLSGMKVKKDPKPEVVKQTRPPRAEPTTTEQSEFLEKRRKLRIANMRKKAIDNYTPTDLFDAEKALGIFSKVETVTEPILKTWQGTSEREMRVLKTQYPRNLIEDMVQMTDKGILWHFPINNEQGVEEKEKDSFVDHVFLEQHIESWCPQEGPIREFMEVVCTSLSKNAFMTVEKKVYYINWFRDYFDQPRAKEILKISGVLE